MALALSRYFEVMAELNALQETEGITDYHEKFELICGDIAFSEPYLVNVYLAGLQPETQRIVRMFRPTSIRHCLLIGRLYESVHPCKPKEAIEECLRLPKSFAIAHTPKDLKVGLASISFDFPTATWHQSLVPSELGRTAVLDRQSSTSLLKERFAKVLDDPIAELNALQEIEGLPDSHDKFELTCTRVSLPEPYLGLFPTVKASEQQFTSESQGAPRKFLTSEQMPESRAKGLSYFGDDKFAPAHNLKNKKPPWYMLDCGAVLESEETNQFHMSLNQVTISYASKVFDRMPTIDVGMRSEELCSAAVLQQFKSLFLWPHMGRFVFEPGGLRVLFVHRFPEHWRQVAVELIHRRLQWDPGDCLIAGFELLHCSLVLVALVKQQVVEDVGILMLHGLNYVGNLLIFHMTDCSWFLGFLLKFNFGHCINYKRNLDRAL